MTYETMQLVCRFDNDRKRVFANLRYIRDPKVVLGVDAVGLGLRRWDPDVVLCHQV